MKRIISTILTISMLFTMIPAFASDIETSDVNNIAQLYSVGSGEAVYASSADKLNVIKADYSSLEVGTYTETKSGKNCKINVKANSTGSFTVNDDGSVTLKQSSGNEDASFEFHNTPRNGMVVSTFKIKYDVLPTAWTRLEYSNSFSSFCVTGGKFSLNNTYKVGDETKGAVDTVSSDIVEGMWYTVTYLINNAEKTYKLDIVDENGDSIVTDATKDWSFRPTAGGAVTGTVGTLTMNTAQGGQNEFTVKDIYAYQIVDVCDFDVIGPVDIVDGNNAFRLEYNNTTEDTVDFNALLVAYDANGVVVGTDVEAGTIDVGTSNVDLEFDIPAADSYKVFVNDANGAALCIKAGGVSDKAPADFVNVSCAADGKLVVDVAKDNAYNVATVAVYDENENIVGYAQQKNAGTSMLFGVPSYNTEYTVAVTLNDAARNVVTNEASIIAWNPEIAADFNTGDVEAAFEAHMDAIKLAYDGDFAALYEENAEYINNYIALRDDYQSVYDIVDAIYAAEGFISVVSAEDETAFANAFETNAESFGIAIDSVYTDNKDVIIAKLYAAKDDIIVPEELVDVYNNIYIACEFNNAPAIIYGKLFEKYAANLGITVTKEYYKAEATYNEAVFARKDSDFGGAFDAAEDVARAFRLAALDIEGKPVSTYATVGTSPVTKPVTTVNFEANSAPWAVSYKPGNDASKGIAEVVEYNGNKAMKITQYAGNEDEVTFAVNNLYSSNTYDSLNIKERLIFEKLDTGYLFLRTRAGYLYVENGKWGINYGGGNMVTSGTKEDITTGVWYNLDFDFDFPAKKFDLVITKDDGTVVFEDYGCDFRGGDVNSMLIQTPHKDGKDSNGIDRTTVEDTVIYVDDIVITAPTEDAVYYTAKSADKFNAGINGVAVEVENLTGADRDINVYVPVYVDGNLYTFANETVFLENGEMTDVVVSYELDEELFGETPAEIDFEVIVADSFDGVNHSIASKTAAGILTVDAYVDFEAEVINVETETTFDNGTILVLAPGATINSADAADVIYYGVAKNVDIKVADGIVGDINVYAVAQNAEGQVTVADATVYYPGNGVAEQLVADFAVVTDETVADTVAQYIDIIDSVEPGMKAFYEDNTDAVNNALVANKPYESTQDVINIIKSVKALAALTAATDIAEFEQAFDEFAVMFDVEFDSIYTANKDTFIEQLYAQKATFATYADVMAAYDEIYMICDFNTATEDTIGAKLAEYADVLGIVLDDVYTSKQVYVDRLVAADKPFADKAAVVSSYNNAYAKAEALEGDFTKKVVASTSTQLSKFTLDFEDCAPVTGATSSSGMSFGFTKVGNGSFDIAADGDNQYLVVRQAEDTGSATTNVSFNTSSINGDYVTVEYQIRFDKPSSKWTMLNLGDLSSLYLNGNKFNLNESNNAATTTEGKGGQKNISGTVSANVWYTVTYNIDFPAQAYNITIKDETGLEIANTNTKPRNWATKTYSSVPNLQLYTPQSESGEYQVSYDNIAAYATPSSGTIYNITGTSTLLPGENVFTAEITNADAVANTYTVYVPVYVDGKLAVVNKEEITVDSKSSTTESIDITAPATGNTEYEIFVVDSLGGINYGVSSAAVAPRTINPAKPVADYASKSIKVSGVTTNDNLTIVVTGPMADGRDYDLTEAQRDSDVIVYYAPAKLTSLGYEEDRTTNEKIYTNTFAADIKVPDRFVDGMYNIYLISQNKAGDVQIKDDIQVYYAGNSKLDDMLAAFNGLTDANVTDTVNSYMDVFLGVDDDIDVFYIANEDEVNAALLAVDNFANVGEINDVIFTIYAVDKMASTADEDEFRLVFEYYADVFGIDTLTPDYAENSQQICERLFAQKDSLTTDNVKEKYEDALMLAEFDAATRDTIAAVLEKYEDAIGIDTQSAEYKKYKANINKIMTAEDVTYNSIEDIKAAYEKGLKFAKENSGSNAATKPSSSGGSGGGSGSGSGVISTTVSKPHIETETTIDGGTAYSAFADIDTVPWAKEAITALKKYGVINGVSETQFAPERNVTREEFAKMLVNAFGITGEGKTFADVQAGSWYAPYVTTLASSGIVNGISETEFGVGANITRQDAAVMLDRVAKHIGMELEFDISALNIFNDYMADYAKDSIYRLYQSGVINGTSATTFSATDSLTRAQAAKLIYGLMQLNK